MLLCENKDLTLDKFKSFKRSFSIKWVLDTDSVGHEA